MRFALKKKKQHDFKKGIKALDFSLENNQLFHNIHNEKWRSVLV